MFKSFVHSLIKPMPKFEQQSVR